MRFRHQNQLHVPVQSSVKCKIRFLGIDGVIVTVIHRYGQFIVFPQMLCQFHAKGGIASLMGGQMLSVQADVGCHGSAANLQIHSGPLLHDGFVQTAGIQADAPGVIIAPVLPVHGIPGVRQLYFRSLTVLRKDPVFIQRYNLSHNDSPLYFTV